MKIKPLKVSELNNYISRIINNDVLLYNIKIEGEVSNCKYHTNGHIYLSLKDESSLIRGIVFNQYIDNIDFKIENGMNIIVSGYIDIYKRDGTCQIVIEKAEISGRGKIYQEFERLKAKLSKEGLFDNEYKKPIPKYPNKIGIITSITGAAIRDLITNIKRRNYLVDIIIYPTLVQGDKSAENISSGIEELDIMDLDLIIIARGGGSVEDLSSFNEEIVARTIFKAKTPIISAIGHETDFTIADFVSDKRASTPSTAAEIAVEDIELQKLALEKILMNIIEYMNNKIDKNSSSLLNYRKTLEMLRVDRKILDYEKNLEYIYDGLNNKIVEIIDSKTHELNKKGTELDLLSPMRVLSRGYAIVRDQEKKVLKSAKSLEIKQNIDILFSDGSIKASVEKIYDQKK
ncbi:MAG: exodeoxyribonuclease VII large subunit [Andreesenia angusta]|nr:exodeoxyribonuclease VII large subunit [Andreesenia angusta]